MDIVEVGIIDLDIPLLLSEQWLGNHEATMDFKKKILYLKDVDEVIQLKKTKGGHLGICLEKNADRNADELVQNVLFAKETKNLLFPQIKKIHREF